eukprot:6186253-Pleurochrysis_carterae.AAC.4
MERHELVEAARTHDRRVENVGAISRADDKDGLARADAVDLGEDLVDHAISRLRRAAAAGAARLGDGVHLVEEDDARRRLARLVEELAHVGLRLAKPLRKQLGTLDRDERLAAAGRAVEEHALGRVHAELLKLGRVLHRVLHKLAQLALDVLEAADVLPRNVRHFDRCLPQRRRVCQPERLAHVVRADNELVEGLLRQLVGLEVERRQLLAHAKHRRLEDGLRQVGAAVALAVGRHRLQVDIGAHAHVARLDAQNVEPAGLVRDGDVQLEVEAAEAAQRGLDGIGPVGGGHQHHLRLWLEAVHERDELRDDAPLDLALRLVAARRDGVEFIDEDDGGRLALGVLKGLAQV